MYMLGGISRAFSRIGRGLSPRLEPRRLCSRRPGHGDEVVFGFARLGFDQEPVFDAGLQRIRRGVLYGGPHASDMLAVGEIRDGDGIGVGDKVPDRMRILVGLDVTDGDDFERRELELPVDIEEDGVGGRVGRALGPAEESRPRGTGTMKDE